MSKIDVISLDGDHTLIFELPIVMEDWVEEFNKSINERNIFMLQKNGMYWLIPIEVIKESILLVDYRSKTKSSPNSLPPITIGIEQCIPIPSKTAKILLEL